MHVDGKGHTLSWRLKVTSLGAASMRHNFPAAQNLVYSNINCNLQDHIKAFRHQTMARLVLESSWENIEAMLRKR